MKVIQEAAENGRIHLITSLQKDEVLPYLKEAEGALREEGDLPHALLAVDTEAFSADAMVQNKLRSYVMELLAEKVLRQERFMPASQLIYLTKDAVLPGESFEFIISALPQPSVELTSYGPVEAFQEELQVTEEEVKSALAELALRSASLVPKDAASSVKEHDFVEVETAATRNGEEYEQLTAKKRLYRVGEEFLPAEFDQNLLGMKRGECKTFSLCLDKDHAPLEISVLILGIYEERAPQPDDDWIARKFPGMGGLEGLKEHLRKEIREKKRPQYEEARAQAALRQLARRVSTPVPEEVFEARFTEIYRTFCKEIKHSQGLGIEEYFYKQGITERQLKEEMAFDVRSGLIEGFALDAYARHHKLAAEEGDYQQVLHTFAPGEEAAMRLEYGASGRSYLLEEAALRNRALRHLLDTAR